MADVFISYSRRDSDFVRHLHGELTARNRDTWVDWEDIPPTAQWMSEISTAIEIADNFVFVIAPESVRSATCLRELEHAVAYNKRLDSARPARGTGCRYSRIAGAAELDLFP